MAMIDFTTLEKPGSPNTYLVCTPGICRAARADEAPPVFAQNVAAVRAAIQALAPNVSWRESADGVQGAYVATTALMRFKDDVDILLTPSADGGTRLCVYSRSRIGHSDLGANRKRVKKLIADLRARLS